RVVLAALLLAASWAILPACRPRLIELPFETIAQSEGFSTGRSPADPNFLVITEPEQVDSPGLDVQFPADLAGQLRAVDYQKNFVVAVFRGTLTGTSPELDVEVLRVVRNGDDVVVQARFGELEPGKLILPGFSSPYHVVAVTREGQWSRDIRFVVEVDGEEVVERTYFIP
ncbi:MAG TPA: hypothetical protein VIK64_12955, partial [Anaerolineales bacterium]